MRRKSQNEKIIFGLKARKLRLERGLSFAEMNSLTGLSSSYLNEIEKGKKYPKKDKVKIIAKAFNVSEKTLTSPELPRALAPVEDLLKSNFINELPLDIIGLDIGKVVEMISNAPSRVGAFVATLLDLSRNYALGEENFYFGALRAFLEMHNNYFEEIEKEIENFTEKFELKELNVSSEKMNQILKTEFGYQIIENGLSQYVELSNIRALFIPKEKKLLLNKNLSQTQKEFQFAKEIGFNFLNLKERAYTASLLRVNSFEEVLSHFKAGYFAAGLLIKREAFVADLKSFFKNEKWEEVAFAELLEKYNVTPETFFQRMTNLLPEFLGIKNIFFLRIIQNADTSNFRINRELHINRRHPPHSNGLNEHYCRRWTSGLLLKKLAKEISGSPKSGNLIGVQNSRFHSSGEEYFTLTVAKKTNKNQNVSVTIGILKDSIAQKKIKFLNDPNILTKSVNTTCERCPIKDCESRVAPASVIEKKEILKKIKRVIDKISG